MPAFPCSFLANVVPALTDSSVTPGVPPSPPSRAFCPLCVHLQSLVHRHQFLVHPETLETSPDSIAGSTAHWRI